MQVTLNLTENVYRHAERLAKITGKNVNDILTSMLENSFPQGRSVDTEMRKSFSSLSDEEILALSNLQMEPQQDQRLSELLYQQQARDLNEAEREELERLMQIYKEGLLQKAHALREAVQRGLRAPLEP